MLNNSIQGQNAGREPEAVVRAAAPELAVGAADANRSELEIKREQYDARRRFSLRSCAFSSRTRSTLSIRAKSYEFIVTNLAIINKDILFSVNAKLFIKVLIYRLYYREQLNNNVYL